MKFITKRFTRKLHVSGGLILFIIFLVVSMTAPIRIANGQIGTSNRELALLGDGVEPIAGLLERIGITDDASVTITILPFTLAPHAENITVAERKDLLDRAASLQSEINNICLETHSGKSICSVYIAPIFVRADAQNPDYIDSFRRTNDILFIPDGDPAIAMGVIGGTPVEEKLNEAYLNGVTIAASGRAVSLLSSAMLTGRTELLETNPPLSFGYANVWHSAENHGLLFGNQSAIINDQPFALDHLSTLIGAVTQPESPHIGISIEEAAGLILPETGSLETVFGSNGVVIVDAETYHAADNVRYTGCQNKPVAILPCSPFLSIRNVLVHSIKAGGTSYSLTRRSHSLTNPPPTVNRQFDALELPSSAGALLISGHDINYPQASPALAQFRSILRATGSQVLIYADGFYNPAHAEQVAENYAAALDMDHHILVTDANQTRAIDLPSGDEYDGIVFIAEDISAIKPQMAVWMEEQWLSGKPVLAEGAAVQIIGRDFYANLNEPQTSTSPFRVSLSDRGSGMRLLNVNFASMQSISGGMDWNALFKLGVISPEYLAVGIPANTALEISAQSVKVIGDNVVALLDFRSARFAVSEDSYTTFANGFIDIFTPGEIIEAQSADSSLNVSPLPTPEIISPTPTPTATAIPSQTPPIPTPTEKPTKTPRPTSTPPIIPPPSNPDIDHWMIAFGVLIVIVIIFGVLISRQSKPD